MPLTVRIAAALVLATALAVITNATLLATEGRRTQTTRTTEKRAAHFNSDRLMTVLRDAGIRAEFEGDLVARPEVVGLPSTVGLVNVLLLNVDKHLSETELETLRQVAARFFGEGKNWAHAWRYRAIAAQPRESGAKLQLARLDQA